MVVKGIELAEFRVYYDAGRRPVPCPIEFIGYLYCKVDMDVYWDEYSGGGTHKEKVQKTVHHDAETTTKIYWYCPDCGEKVYQNNKPSY